MNMESHVKAKLEMKAIFRPADPKMSMSEALDRTQEIGNQVLDHGDRQILVGHEKGKIVAYAMVRELCPPNATFEQFTAHMKAIGFDVRGEGQLDIDGNRTLLVWEQEIF